MGPFQSLAALAVLLPAFSLSAQQPPADSDHDGLSDQLEQRLLTQFTPKFMMGTHECSVAPAEFAQGIAVPRAVADNSTIYGQAFRVAGAPAAGETVELHYYHLWKTDCGPHGHPLDAEHVSVLLRHMGNDADPVRGWKAAYWFAAAHENTVCDVSQISRASTLKAEERGATVWISPGKHASYLNATLCHAGCGADRCEAMQPVAVSHIINLGEPGAPMNGSQWIASSQWPLLAKMSVSDFPSEPLARLETLPESDIAWFHPGRHPAQGVIAISSTTANAIGGGGDSAVSAISVARDHTGNALSRSYHATTHALGTSAQHVGKAIGATKDEKPK